MLRPFSVVFKHCDPSIAQLRKDEVSMIGNFVKLCKLRQLWKKLETLILRKFDKTTLVFA